MPNNKPNQRNTPKPKTIKKKKKSTRKNQTKKTKGKRNDDGDSPALKKRNSKASPQADSSNNNGKKSPPPDSPKSSTTLEKLEQVNVDMKNEVKHFEEEFVNNAKDPETPVSELKPGTNMPKEQIDKTPKGDKPLQDITTPRRSQPNLQMFGFHKNNKDPNKEKEEEIRKAQEDYVQRKGEDKFVAGIGFNVLKVEPGTFAKLDNGETEIETTPINLADKHPEFIGPGFNNGGKETSQKSEISKLQKSNPEEGNNQKEENEKEANENDNSNELDTQSQDFPICDENDELIRKQPEQGNDNNSNKSDSSIDEKKKQKYNQSEKKVKRSFLSPSNHFTPIVHDNILDNNNYGEEEDDIDTIDSGETSIISSKKEADKEVPPKFIRYRFVIELNHLDLHNDDKNDYTPEEKYRQIFWDLAKYIKQIDSDAKFISWKNNPTFTVLPVNNDDFPTEPEKIAVFFNGFRAKLKMDYRNTFRICINSPKWNDTWMEMKLAAWAQARSYFLSKCNIQSEESTVIGWLVYSFPFSNITSLKSFLMSKTDYEWGFKLGSPTTSDKHLQWKDRMKALEVMVPLDRADSARQLISEVFSPYKKQGKHKSYTDCYLFVGRENEYKSDDLAMIYSEMLGRHKFRLSTIEIAQVTSIIKDIDRRVVTKQNQIMTIREMILNLQSKEQKLVPCNIFLSVDFVAKADSMWFRNTKGKGGACYYLTYYSWDAGEATNIAKGLGKYLAHYYGIEAVEDYFDAAHWTLTKSWKWNKKRQQFDTPEQQHLAANVLYDPTSAMIRAYNQHQFDKQSGTNDTSNQKKKSLPNINDVSQIGNRDMITADPIPPPDSEDAKKIADEAMSIAMNLHNTTHNSHDSDEHNGDNLGTLEISNDKDEYNKRMAMKINQKEADPDLDSLPSVGGKTNRINNIFNSDIASVASSVTDMTNNTINKTYHNEEASLNSDASSMVSDTSIQSIQAVDIRAMMDSGIPIEEIKQNIAINAAHIKMKAAQKADKLLAVTLQMAREQEQEQQHQHENMNEQENTASNNIDAEENNVSRNMNDDEQSNSSSQSSSNCDAADEK